MSVRVTALFSNADEADFALMRLRSAGIITEKTRIVPSHAQHREEKGLLRTIPVATNVAGAAAIGSGAAGSGAFGLAGVGFLAQTDSMQDVEGADSRYVQREVMLEVIVKNEDARTCEALLYSSHGREVKSV